MIISPADQTDLILCVATAPFSTESLQRMWRYPMHKILLPIEGRRWSVSLCVQRGEAPPGDINEVMAFAKSFRQPTIYNVQGHFNSDRVASAIPLTERQSCSEG
jgi:hypothetical protein